MAYTLIGPDGRAHASEAKGRLGGNRSTRIYGRLDCPTARRHLASGGYEANRVFFASTDDAAAAGYRPCHVCMPAEYAAWHDEPAD